VPAGRRLQRCPRLLLRQGWLVSCCSRQGFASSACPWRVAHPPMNVGTQQPLAAPLLHTPSPCQRLGSWATLGSARITQRTFPSDGHGLIPPVSCPAGPSTTALAAMDTLMSTLAQVSWLACLGCACLGGQSC
jgi:hypothetical protein